jgi:starch synthase
MKIVMCASEVVPFAKTGGLADVAGALPLALEKLKEEVIVIMPKYKSVTHSEATIGKGVKVYFIENNKYFNRPGLYGEKTGDYPDNLERFSYFSKSALELLKKIDYQADIIHCHDWQSGLVPVYLKTLYKDKPFYKKMKTALTIHNIGYQGVFGKEEFPKLGLDWSLFNIETLEYYDKINFLKGGIAFSDIINTVSPTYSQEIMTQEQGFGMDGLLRKRRESVFGILNGLDYDLWDPAKDKFLAKKYSADSMKDKLANKAALQKECGLPVEEKIPLFGFVGRLAEQKGIDILEKVLRRVYQLGIQVVILGTGDQKYHVLLEEAAAKYPRQICLYLKFDDALAHRIYSGCDVFLMPSRYEPCGLGQLISFKYGTTVVASKTGGLADTVVDFDPAGQQGNGFVFESNSREGLLEAMLRAALAFHDKKIWDTLIARCAGLDFSWQESAKRYIELYKKAIKG